MEIHQGQIILAVLLGSVIKSYVVPFLVVEFLKTVPETGPVQKRAYR